tara:strand:+ start:441 stop:1685 length:1245 start_codon:yes stop_codon:yes gene_type:complete
MNKVYNKTVKHIYKHPKTIFGFTLLCLFVGYFHLLHNSVMQICILLTTIGLFLYERTNNYLYFFLLLFIFILNEFLYVTIGFDLFSSHARTELLYSASYITDLFNIKEQKKVHSNLTEGLYPNCQITDIDQAEINRFNKFMELSNIEPGDSVLDAGCGNGNLVEYMRSKGVYAHGITITKYQYERNVNLYGNHYTHGDYTKLHTHLINNFDHIVLPGSLEHPFGGCVFKKNTVKNKSEKMTKMFVMFKQYYKKDSKKKNLLTTCIHTHGLEHPIWNLKNKAISYCTERMFGGCYPTYGKHSVNSAMTNAGYNVIMEEDFTKAYYLSSYYSLEHFGNPSDIGYSVLAMSLIYPFVIHSWFYWKYGMWMWMWSGSTHKRRNENEDICDPNKSCDLFYEEDLNKRPCSLLYTVSSCV